MGIIFDECKHPGKKKCYVDKSKLTCPKSCEKLMDCKLHPCEKICGSPHDHSKCQADVTFHFPGCSHVGKKLCYEDAAIKICKKKIDFQFGKCGHKGRKACYEDQSTFLCKETVNDKKPGCGHEVQRKCHQSVRDVECPHPCINIMDCGEHKCAERCGSAHGHGGCKVKIKYQFLDCKHDSPMRKLCSEPITWKCLLPKMDLAKCGHRVSFTDRVNIIIAVQNISHLHHTSYIFRWDTNAVNQWTGRSAANRARKSLNVATSAPGNADNPARNAPRARVPSPSSREMPKSAARISRPKSWPWQTLHQPLHLRN